MRSISDSWAGSSSGTKRYTHWFGECSDENRNIIQSHFRRIVSDSQIASYTCDCTCDKDDVYAYVRPDQPGTMYICQMFFASPLTGTDSQADTLVHESSHFTINSGTFDYAYGQDDCTELAQSNPANAVMNADSHEYFAENIPFES
ncbi:hypothetical protein BOTBODRAFT_270216 [Botryobasidium botryosum FD-172 SS1]|uniref:Lysine-specific metallo-endopeptidase domain-containing protein n=1 Tax=Botryobasidium botryosum (strain FD-172 SS1) TaxID=930990 RepID=A0A067MK83_BOTB1|nr:hypothetical protein BOTBODRAFT_270216 [Botryobasidium botryosum FD-172 SS1]